MTKSLIRLYSFLMTLSLPALAMADQPHPKQLGFQQPVTPVMTEIAAFHDNLLIPIITAITVFVMLLLIYVMVRFNAKANPVPSTTTHNVPLEIVWTVVPVIILILIAIPSFRLLYLGAVHPETELTLKVTGNQWNWTYEYPDNGGVSFTSYMVPTKEIDPAKNQVKLLSTDVPVVLPVDTNILFQVTASDVLHAFAVPAFGVKTDAVPGRLNEVWARVTKPGVYFGQCSELCGKDHGFMPIEIHVVSKEDFNKWIVEKGGSVKADTPAPDATVPAAAPSEADQAKEAPAAENEEAPKAE